MKIISVVGARPNFMKIAPFIKAIDEHNKQSSKPIQHTLVHTGQHYDDRMSQSFFEALNIPNADINLGIGSGSHAEQVGKTMMEFEKVLMNEKPDWVVVVGDVNATLACSVTAKKEKIKCCHIEAGLRSNDMDMPEEINRLVTDRLSDLLLYPDKISGKNLMNEGVPENNRVFVGNIMIDTLELNKDKASRLQIDQILNDNALEDYQSPRNFRITDTDKFGIITMHRPSNVDNKDVLEPLTDFLCKEACSNIKLIWPIHPRTRNRLKEFNLLNNVLACNNIQLLHPIGYHEMLRLNIDAKIMLTDSGGLQEECTVLGTPCLTLRWNTERPVTLIEHGGASVLVGNNIGRIRTEFFETLSKNRKPVKPELWDGKAAIRCLKAIINYSA
ncbi:MAG: UDP-N-acetylglucosamine 2-epimerase (non-hydrolyzing) [Bacteroidales bacterium]|nr:UDP-N-acetylglucosamine 2-epimerase (non-hydrolyzing) [Bacteroidales bacterium]